MAALVLDASVVLAVALQEPNRHLAAAMLALAVEDSAAVPAIWHLEVGNILLAAERRGTISAADRMAALEDLFRLPVDVDQETASRAWRDTLILAERHRLTLYDAAYLELSARRSLPLATFDAALRRAATAVGVKLLRRGCACSRSSARLFRRRMQSSWRLTRVVPCAGAAQTRGRGWGTGRPSTGARPLGWGPVGQNEPTQ